MANKDIVRYLADSLGQWRGAKITYGHDSVQSEYVRDYLIGDASDDITTASQRLGIGTSDEVAEWLTELVSTFDL